MKTMRRFALVGIVVFLALSLGTCGAGPADGDEGSNALVWTDYEIMLSPDGLGQITLYLPPEGMDENTQPGPDTYGVAVPKSRMLNQNIARRSYDYLEAIFIGTGANVIARTSWEIGQPAGIRGVERDIDYGNGGNAIICVGRKISNGLGTLLAIGTVTAVGIPAGTTPLATPTTIPPHAISVTFTVSGIRTEVGYDFTLDDPLSSFGESFLTSTGGDAAAGGFLEAPNVARTVSGLATFKGGATYTMFALPGFDKRGTTITANPFKVYAEYAFTLTDAGTNTAAAIGITFADLKVWDVGTTPPSPTAPFEIEERLALYRTMGQKFDVNEANLDTATTVGLSTRTGSYYSNAANASFYPVIPLEFSIVKESQGVFAFTFRTSVYALSNASATNGGPEAVRWYVGVAHGEDRYVLDDRKSAAGMVLMGVNISALDWLEIIVTWITPPPGP